jgi:hypothetical protein
MPERAFRNHGHFAALQIRQRVVWNVSSGGHVGRAMKEVERTLAEVDENLKSNVKTTLAPVYCPESDKTQESDDTVMKG